MRYVLIDLDGSTLDRFATEEAVRDELRAMEQEQAGVAMDLVVLAYTDAGEREGDPIPASDFLAEAAQPAGGGHRRRTFVSYSLMVDPFAGGASAALVREVQLLPWNLSAAARAPVVEPSAANEQAAA